MYGTNLGEMAWMDLSTEHAQDVKDFYQSILGWQSEPIAMTNGDEKYHDYVMKSVKPNQSNKVSNNSSEESSGGFVTGICHAKGANKDMPSAWLPYFLVMDIDVAAVLVIEKGGSLVTEVKNLSQDKMIVIKDPCGAMCALYQKV